MHLNDSLCSRSNMRYLVCKMINKHLVIVLAGEEEDSILMANISNRDLIFKYDILREATSNFKVENKLGDGGFGSVFKVRA